MKRWLTFGCMSVVAASIAGPLYADQGGGGAKGAATKSAAAGEASGGAAATLEGPAGLHFGMTSGAIAKLYEKVFDAEFLPRYRKAQPGSEMDSLDSELADRKAELKIVIEFGDTPVALESTPLRLEFTHNNNESVTHTALTRVMMNDDLKGERKVEYERSFFFFSDKVWKIYDEFKTGKNGLYPTFEKGIEKLSVKLGQAKILQADEAQLRLYRVAQWTKGTMVVQLVDRHEDGHLALVSIQKSVFDNLGQYRTSHPETQGVSSQVREATSGKSNSQGSNGSSPADAYTRKRHHD